GFPAELSEKRHIPAARSNADPQSIDGFQAGKQAIHGTDRNGHKAYQQQGCAILIFEISHEPNIVCS
uniref:Uncharacterized protein n=1 Tax=Anopheles dirus TaxID=7168 RepID=A0A182NYS5_9DIPT